MDHPRFSDFAKEERYLEGPKKRIDEVLNLEILITGFKVGKSKYKNKDKSEDTNYLTLLPGWKRAGFKDKKELSDLSATLAERK